jgi:hypothetical protein
MGIVGLTQRKFDDRWQSAGQLRHRECKQNCTFAVVRRYRGASRGKMKALLGFGLGQPAVSVLFFNKQFRPSEEICSKFIETETNSKFPMLVVPRKTT